MTKRWPPGSPESRRSGGGPRDARGSPGLQQAIMQIIVSGVSVRGMEVFATHSRMTRLRVPLRATPALLRLALAAAVSAQSAAEIVTRYRDANAPGILRDFAKLLSYPNRARDKEDIERAANYIRDQLQSVGVTSELL